MTAGLIWSFVLSGVGVVGIILAGSKYKLGWLIGFFVQPLWIAFALTTGQYGFILNAVIYATVYGRNWLRWRREESGTVPHPRWPRPLEYFRARFGGWWWKACPTCGRHFGGHEEGWRVDHSHNPYWFICPVCVEQARTDAANG